MLLPASFYRRENTCLIAKELLGKVLVTRFGQEYTSGIIVETEAYRGAQDRASHAYGNKRTARTEVMYAPGGRAYVYLCYGIHHLFNIVTHGKDVPHAVLIRGIEPLEGIPLMLKRRRSSLLRPSLTAGPGVLSEALGIRTIHSGQTLLHGKDIYIEDTGILVPDKEIICTGRIGVAYAGDDAALPYRFFIRSNPYVSKGKTILPS